MTREERAYNYASKKNPSKYTVGEIAKHYDDGYTDGYKDAVDKTLKWLYNEYNLSGYLDLDNIDDWKKYMEEQK